MVKKESKEQLIVLNKHGALVKDYSLDQVRELNALDSTVFYHNSPSGYGYRVEKATELIREYLGAKDLFTGGVNTALFLNLFWEHISVGEDKYGKYVDIFGRRVYPSFDVGKPDGEGFYTRAGGGYRNYRITIRELGVKFGLDGYYLTYLLFHNIGGFNPLVDWKEVYPPIGKEESTELSDMIIEPVKIIRPELKSLVATLYEKELLLRGHLNYYTLCPTSDIQVDGDILGIELDAALLGLEEPVSVVAEPEIIVLSTTEQPIKTEKFILTPKKSEVIEPVTKKKSTAKVKEPVKITLVETIDRYLAKKTFNSAINEGMEVYGIHINAWSLRTEATFWKFSDDKLPTKQDMLFIHAMLVYIDLKRSYAVSLKKSIVCKFFDEKLRELTVLKRSGNLTEDTLWKYEYINNVKYGALALK